MSPACWVLGSGLFQGHLVGTGEEEWHVDSEKCATDWKSHEESLHICWRAETKRDPSLKNQHLEWAGNWSLHYTNGMSSVKLVTSKVSAR